MRKSAAIIVSAIALGLVVFAPFKASAQGVSIYIGPGPGYPGYAYYPPYPPYGYGYGYQSYGYAYPSYGYGNGYGYGYGNGYGYGYGRSYYGRPYYGTYWGRSRRVARRVYRRQNRW